MPGAIQDTFLDMSMLTMKGNIHNCSSKFELIIKTKKLEVPLIRAVRSLIRIDLVLGEFKGKRGDVFAFWDFGLDRICVHEGGFLIGANQDPAAEPAQPAQPAEPAEPAAPWNDDEKPDMFKAGPRDFHLGSENG